VDTVLILAREDVVAALLGLLVELRGYQPVFAQSGETIRDACRRISCLKMVIDCDHSECSGRSLVTLRETGVKIVLFSSSRAPSEMERKTSELGLPSFTLPIGPEAFGKLLE